MSGADTVTLAEVGLIRGMLRLVPRPSNQAVLSYFTRPGRDLNHRLISEIAEGWRWAHVPPASQADTLSFMALAASMPPMDHHSFVSGDDYYESDGGSVARPIGNISLDWWPVGQGLFSTGALRLNNGSAVHWAYDCGSTSSAALITSAIAQYRRRLQTWGASRLTLMVLSHFDKDHISGVVELLRGLPVRTFLLPYVPLWRRLVIAMEQGVGAADPLIRFFEDPVAYLSEQDGIEIDEIVFVPGVGPDDRVPGAPDAGESPPDGLPDGSVDELKVEHGSPPAEAAGDPAVEDASSVRVSFLKKGGRLLVPSFWEFVPYNDSQPAVHATPLFLRRAGLVIRIFLGDPSRRSRALARLKKVYDHHFGSGPVERNLISLFLYSGAIGRISLRHYYATDCVDFSRRADAFGQLLTGDGYLDSPQRLNDLRRYLSADARFDRAGIFQVMHHGARGNWHAGAAAAIQPAVSIFSSDPGHKGYRHPHAEVLRDFWPYCPVRVGRTRGFHFHGFLQTR